MLHDCVYVPRTEATKGWGRGHADRDRVTVHCEEKALEGDRDAYTESWTCLINQAVRQVSAVSLFKAECLCVRECCLHVYRRRTIYRSTNSL